MSSQRVIGLLIVVGFLASAQVAWGAIIPVTDSRYIKFTSYSEWDPELNYTITKTPNPAFSDFDEVVPDVYPYAEQTSWIRDWEIVGTGSAEGYGPEIGAGAWGNCRLRVEFEVDSAQTFDLLGFVTNDHPGWGNTGTTTLRLTADLVNVYVFVASSIDETINFAEQVPLVPGVSYELNAEVFHGLDGGGSFSVALQAQAPEPVPSISFGGLAVLAGLVLSSVAWARRCR